MLCPQDVPQLIQKFSIGCRIAHNPLLSRLTKWHNGPHPIENVVYGKLVSVLYGFNVLLQLVKPLPSKEKSGLLCCQILIFAYAAFTIPANLG